VAGRDQRQWLIPACAFSGLRFRAPAPSFGADVGAIRTSSTGFDPLEHHVRPDKPRVAPVKAACRCMDKLPHLLGSTVGVVSSGKTYGRPKRVMKFVTCSERGVRPRLRKPWKDEQLLLSSLLPRGAWPVCGAKNPRPRGCEHALRPPKHAFPLTAAHSPRAGGPSAKCLRARGASGRSSSKGLPATGRKPFRPLSALNLNRFPEEPPSSVLARWRVPDCAPRLWFVRPRSSCPGRSARTRPRSYFWAKCTRPYAPCDPGFSVDLSSKAPETLFPAPAPAPVVLERQSRVFSRATVPRRPAATDGGSQPSP